MKESGRANKEADASDETAEISHLLKLLAEDLMRVLVVELRLFGHTALAMIGLTMLVTLLLVGGWLFAGVALAIALADLDFFSLSGALLAVALLHLVLVALAFWRRRHIARDLMFRESRASANSLLVHARAVAEVVIVAGKAEVEDPELDKKGSPTESGIRGSDSAGRER